MHGIFIYRARSVECPCADRKWKSMRWIYHKYRIKITFRRKIRAMGTRSTYAEWKKKQKKIRLRFDGDYVIIFFSVPYFSFLLAIVGKPPKKTVVTCCLRIQNIPIRKTKWIEWFDNIIEFKFEKERKKGSVEKRGKQQSVCNDDIIWLETRNLKWSATSTLSFIIHIFVIEWYEQASKRRKKAFAIGDYVGTECALIH